MVVLVLFSCFFRWGSRLLGFANGKGQGVGLMLRRIFQIYITQSMICTPLKTGMSPKKTSLYFNRKYCAFEPTIDFQGTCWFFGVSVMGLPCKGSQHNLGVSLGYAQQSKRWCLFTRGCFFQNRYDPRNRWFNGLTLQNSRSQRSYAVGPLKKVDLFCEAGPHWNCGYIGAKIRNQHFDHHPNKDDVFFPSQTWSGAR